ncbi:MAG: hypothetical protein E6Q78_04235 [Rhodoferax sp.]|nr:MAG: hypothetical protein E6Q78_04235 [Rhodoferax sp.]
MKFEKNLVFTLTHIDESLGLLSAKWLDNESSIRLSVVAEGGGPGWKGVDLVLTDAIGHGEVQVSASWPDCFGRYNVNVYAVRVMDEFKTSHELLQKMMCDALHAYCSSLYERDFSISAFEFEIGFSERVWSSGGVGK